MLSLNEKFLLGQYKKAFIVESEGGTPAEKLFSVMLESDLINGLLTCGKRGEPKLFQRGDKVEINSLNRFYGLNALLKKAIQKHRLDKLAIFAPSCILDGLNKAQYFGIGCNWVKTAVALKVGVLCLGSLTENALTAMLLDAQSVKEKPLRFFVHRGSACYQTEKGQKVTVDPETFHHYANTACHYCLNLSAKGSDITFVPLKEPNRALFLIRSERGWRTLAQVQSLKPGEIKFKAAPRKSVEELLKVLREKMVLNVAEIIERVELGLPVPKWSDNKLRKFYRMWNSVENLEEEVF